MDYKIKLCRTKAAFSVKPLDKIKLDFEKIKKEFEVVLDNLIAPVLRVDCGEVVVYNRGAILFKTLRNAEKINQIQDMISEVGL